MGGLSPMHLGLVLVIALLVFGPKKLPEIGRELGQAIREFRKASREVMDSFHEAVEDRHAPAPAYDPYPSPRYQEASYPHSPAPAPDEPARAGEVPSIPSGPPPGTVDRSSPSLANPPEAAAASRPAGSAPEREAATAEPARGPAAAPERNT